MSNFGHFDKFLPKPYTVIANKLKLNLKISADFGVVRGIDYYPLFH